MNKRVVSGNGETFANLGIAGIHCPAKTPKRDSIVKLAAKFSGMSRAMPAPIAR